jgi:hypothetical protein
MAVDSAKCREATTRCRSFAKSSSNWVEWNALAGSWDQFAEQDESLSGSVFEFDISALGAGSSAAPASDGVLSSFEGKAVCWRS